MPTPIVDWAGRPVDQRQTTPGSGQYVYPNRGIWWDTIAADVTPANIIAYIKAADQGTLGSMMQLFDRMVDRDDRLQAVIETRRLALTGVERAIVPRHPEDPRSEAAVEKLNELLDLSGLDLEGIMAGLLDGVPKGIAAYELVWEGSNVIAANEINQVLLKWIDGTLNVDVAQGKEKATYQPIEANKYLVFSPRTKPGSKEKRGILRALSMLWVAKHWALKDWAAFVEVFGMPLRLGVYPDGTTEDVKAELYQALQDIGSDSAAIIPENMRIEFPKAFGPSGAGDRGTPMKELIDYVDKSYAIRLLGQNLTTESESGSGTLAGNAHENVRKDYLRADAKAMAKLIEDDLFRPLIGFNMGWDTPVPRMWFDVEDAQDDESRIKVYVEAAKIEGMEFSKSQIREEFNFREPVDEADTLRVSSSDAGTMDPETFALKAVPRKPSVTAVRDDLDPDSNVQSSGIKASEGITRDALRQSQDEFINILFGFVDKLAQEVDTPEQLRRRIQLAAPDLDGAMEAVGLTLEDVDSIIGQAFLTSTFNGEQAVDNELEIQPLDE